MYVSPPVSVLAIVAIAFTGVAWLKSPPREVVRITVAVPTATYKKLLLWGQKHTDPNGQAPAVETIIEKFVIRWQKGDEPPEK